MMGVVLYEGGLLGGGGWEGGFFQEGGGGGRLVGCWRVGGNGEIVSGKRSRGFSS